MPRAGLTFTACRAKAVYRGIDWSAMRKCRGLAGDGTGPLFTWLHERWHRREHIIITEFTQLFDAESTLLQVLSDLYDCQVTMHDSGSSCFWCPCLETPKVYSWHPQKLWLFQAQSPSQDFWSYVAFSTFTPQWRQYVHGTPGPIIILTFCSRQYIAIPGPIPR